MGQLISSVSTLGLHSLRFMTAFAPFQELLQLLNFFPQFISSEISPQIGSRDRILKKRRWFPSTPRPTAW
jgi:hypothetical protein